VVKALVGHTPGSQMMTVKLKNTVWLFSPETTFYFRENVEKSIRQHRPRFKPDGIYSAYEWIG